MTPSTKYLPHLGVTALIVFLATDYFQKPVSLNPGILKNIAEESHKEDSHKEGSHGSDEGGNLSQEERESRMAIFHYNEGNKFYKEGNYTEAITRYEKALHHNKEFKETLINLSTAYMKNKVFDKALETLQTGQKKFPQDPLFDYNFACYYSLTKNLESGLLAIKQAVEKGFKQFKQMGSDPDLNNLRQSDDYKVWKEKLPFATGFYGSVKQTWPEWSILSPALPLNKSSIGTPISSFRHP